MGDESRVFTTFFIAFGMITIYGILTTRMQEIAYKVESRFMNQTFMLSERVHEITRRFFGLFYYCISLTILTLVGASIFMSVRNPAAKWSYLESVYFAFETITAIGYGDLPFEGEDLMAFGA